MDLNKIRRFNEKMGKPQKMSKGGLIKKLGNRHYFASGGETTLTGPAQTGASAVGTVNNNGLIGTVGNQLGLNNQFQATGAPIQNGTNVGQLNGAYNGAQSGIAQQQGLANQMLPGTQQGLGTQANLTEQLQGVINGTGPNAAQSALNQNTATNVANQAALMAGQRGSSANAGLLARQAAQQGAATQQQIAAQQQLAALAQQQVAQGASAVQGVNNTQQNEQSILQNANTAANSANVSMQSNINNVNAGVAAGNQQQAGNVVNGVGSLLSNVPVVGSLFRAKGGIIASGPHDSHVANFLFAEGGAVPAMLSPGERYLNPEEVKRVVEHGENPLKLGKKVPGKPKVKGDSLKNDTVPADLQEGGVVLPRHIMNKKSRDNAELFVRRAVHMKAPKGSK